MAAAGATAALHLVCDGGPRRYHRVPHEHEAGALVSGRTGDPACLFCRIVAGEIPSTRVFEDDLDILLVPRDHIASAARLTEDHAGLLGRIFATAAEIARSEGIAEGGYRIVTNIGEWGGQSVDHLHFHLMGGRPFSWPPG